MDFNNEDQQEQQLGGQMSFLEHLDELRRRLINSVIIVTIAFVLCLYVSDRIYNFLAIPVQRALKKAQERKVPLTGGRTGNETALPLNSLEEGNKGRYVFDKATKLGVTTVAAGTSILAVVASDNEGLLGLYTDEPIYTNNAVIPSGIRLPGDLKKADVSESNEPSANERMMVTTPMQPFTLYVTVSMYSAIAVALPFLLFQVWGFIAPALYKHERSYVTPFILLSSISFIVGAAFAYYILFPPAVEYLLGIGSDFQIMLNATDYLDFILLIMLAMGLIFQMPAITYVLSRIGIVSAGFLVRSWKIAIVVILIVAAVASPTADIPNMMLFAAPMVVLYIVSIFVAWFFGKKRKTSEV